MARPRIKIDADEVRRLAECGLTRRQICTALGISDDTFARRLKEEKAFESALASGRAQGLAHVAGALYQRALAGDVRAQTFYLRSRAAWNVPTPQRYRDVDDLEDHESSAPSWSPALIRRILDGFRAFRPQNPQNPPPASDGRAPFP